MNKPFWKYIVIALFVFVAAGGIFYKRQFLKERTKNHSFQREEKLPDLKELENFAIVKTYRMGFESLDETKNFYISPQKYLGTSFHNLSREQVYEGNYSHKAWMHGANKVILGQNTNHRGYPTIQFNKTKAGIFNNVVFVEFYVWLDVRLEHISGKDWFSFATFTTYDDIFWQRTILVNLDADYRVHLMHVPDQTKGIQDIYQTKAKKFPLRQWVKLGVLLDFTDQNEYKSPFAKVWQNDELVSAARFNPRLANIEDIAKSLWPPCLKNWDGSSIFLAEKMCNLIYKGGLAQAHFGLYAPPLLSEGVVYNDNLVIYELARK